MEIRDGITLECGHQQIVSEFRVKLATEGREQHRVWCVECNNWSRIEPFYMHDIVVDEGEES